MHDLEHERRHGLIILVVSLCLAGTLRVEGSVIPFAADHNHQVRTEQLTRSLPLVFIENQGQVHEAVAYYLRGRDTSIFFTADGLTYALTELGDQGLVQRWAVRLDFIGASRQPQGEALAGTRLSYFRGDSRSWRTGVRTWSRVVYREIWPGIDLVYEGTVNQLKYSLLIRPGADPSRIRLRYTGAPVEVNPAGELVVTTPIRSFSDQVPFAFQEIDGERVSVEARWTSRPGRAAESADIGFALGEYDPGAILVIDPATVVYSGFIGGSASELATGVAVDGAGNAYVVGYTVSDQASFPEVVGPDLTFNGGDWDAFVAKVKANGSGLDYCGYIGGTGWDMGQGIAVDSSGRAFVTGYATSDQTSFPVVVGPDTTFNGVADAFVAVVKADGSGLDYCGYIGGASHDEGVGVAIDSSGRAIIGGDTRSDQTSFPVLVGPDLTYNGNGVDPDQDSFVARIKADGSGLDYCGYIGGVGYEYGGQVAVSSAGNAFVVGWTESTEATFTAKIGPQVSYQGGTSDAFIAKIATDGSGFDYSGYVGGASWDEGYGVTVDSSGNAYVVGWTLSTETSFPVAVGPDLTHNGNPDVFIARVKASGTGFDYCGYIGGASADFAWGVTVDPLGRVYVVGDTESTETTFPVLGGPDLTYNGGTWDAFVARVKNGGAGLDYCGYIGGAESDLGKGIVASDALRAYVVGGTTSTQSTFPAKVGPDLTYNGGDRDAFVTKILFAEEIFSDGFESGNLSRWSASVP